jgi:hypothetical protein
MLIVLLLSWILVLITVDIGLVIECFTWGLNHYFSLALDVICKILPVAQSFCIGSFLDFVDWLSFSLLSKLDIQCFYFQLEKCINLSL